MTYCGQTEKVTDACIFNVTKLHSPRLVSPWGFSFYKLNMLATYLISTNQSRKQVKVPFATKKLCLHNFLEVFKNERIFIFADNCDNETLNYLSSLNLQVHSGSYGLYYSQVELYKKILEMNLAPDEIVYCSEDDYLHKPGSSEIIKDGLTFADYVTLYDHPDKYLQMYSHGETVKVRRSFYTHWKNTVSTCMTFGFKYQTLKEDFPIIQNYPQSLDHNLFINLKQKGRYLYSSMPGYACQMDNYMNSSLSNNTEKWAIDILINEGLSKLSEQKLNECKDMFDDNMFYQKLYWIDGALRSEEKDE